MSNGTQSIDRAAQILSLVVRADDPISYTEVVETTDLARSTVSRLLSALERNGLVERNGEGLYRGGSLFATYASRFDRVETLVAAADPILQRVSEETGETVNLAVPSSNAVVQVAQVDSTFVLGATNWADVTVPSHASALGKVMYAFGAIPVPTGRLERLTPRTLGSRKELMTDLARCATAGSPSSTRSSSRASTRSPPPCSAPTIRSSRPWGSRDRRCASPRTTSGSASSSSPSPVCSPAASNAR